MNNELRKELKKAKNELVTLKVKAIKTALTELPTACAFAVAEEFNVMPLDYIYDVCVLFDEYAENSGVFKSPRDLLMFGITIDVHCRNLPDGYRFSPFDDMFGTLKVGTKCYTISTSNIEDFYNLSEVALEILTLYPDLSNESKDSFFRGELEDFRKLLDELIEY